MPACQGEALSVPLGLLVSKFSTLAKSSAYKSTIPARLCARVAPCSGLAVFIGAGASAVGDAYRANFWAVQLGQFGVCQ